MSSQYPHHDLTRSTSYNPDEINIDGITDYLSTLQTSTPYTHEHQQQTPFTLLQGDAPLYRSIALPEEVITEPPLQHVNKDLGDVTISLDTYGQPHSHEEDYYGAVLPSPQTPTVSVPVTAHHHTSSSSIFSPHTPPSFEQQASTQSLPPASPTLSTDSSSSSSVSYSTSHLESEYPPPSHDALMRNDSCISVYHSEVSITNRRDDILIDEESELDDTDACMPDADSDELPPIGMYPRLIRQNGVYRQPSITSF